MPLSANELNKNRFAREQWVVASSRRTDYIVTNDWTQESTAATQEVCSYRWRIEQLHRKRKQTTGLEKCQCRLARIQRNHIGYVLLVWARLNQFASQAGCSLYRLKHGLFDNYLVSFSREHPRYQCTQSILLYKN